MADETQDLLNESLEKIDAELEGTPAPSAARIAELRSARKIINDQLDDLQADALHDAAAAVKKAADALAVVVASGSTDPLAIILRKLQRLQRAG